MRYQDELNHKGNCLIPIFRHSQGRNRYANKGYVKGSKAGAAIFPTVILIYSHIFIRLFSLSDHTRWHFDCFGNTYKWVFVSKSLNFCFCLFAGLYLCDLPNHEFEYYIDDYIT